MKETIAVICADGLFAERPSISGLEDVINYLMMRESYACFEDADDSPVKRMRWFAK